MALMAREMTLDVTPEMMLVLRVAPAGAPTSRFPWS